MKHIFKSALDSKRAVSYLGIVLVVLIWGISPLFTVYLFQFYSAAILTAARGVFAVLALCFVCRKQLKSIDKRLLRVAVPCGVFYSLGEVLQKVGLQYTTPTTSAFLENFSCVAVPILMFLFIRKKPTLLKIGASILCIGSAFILNMTGTGSFSVGIGEVLCALAGLSYGVNIAGTGVYGKALDSRLFVLVQMCVFTVVSFLFALVMHFVPAAGGQSTLEPIRFSFHPLHLFYIFICAVFISVLCWLIRTAAMKHVDASVVAVIMPFSAAVTGIFSVLFGKDTLSLPFVLGVVLGLCAVLMSAVGDNRERRAEQAAAEASLEE